MQTSILISPQHRNKSADALLELSTSILDGIDDAADAFLRTLGIRTVADLATHPLMTNAHKVAEIANGLPQPVTSSLVDTEQLSEPADDLVSKPLTVLEGFDVARARAFETQLGLTTVAQLAEWPPAMVARRILADALGSVELAQGRLKNDDGTPDELMPKARTFATERLTFRQIYFDEVSRTGPASGETKDIEVFAKDGRLSPFSDENVFQAPAIGAILTMEQNWVPYGLSLGRLLHSLALAPAESTKIAILEWDRRTTGQRSDSDTQTAAVTATGSRSRSIDEVYSTVVSDQRNGKSTTTTDSTTNSVGVTLGGGFGPITAGFNAGSATTEGFAETVTNSSGTANAAGTLSQFLTDSTLQASSAVRSRHAATVVEATSSGTERAETRIVVNYNHSHALTVQYYEVVQVYKVETRLQKVDRVVFIPMRPIDFEAPGLVERYYDTLIAAAPDTATRKTLTRAALHRLRLEGNRRPVDLPKSIPLLGYSVVGFAGTTIIGLEFSLDDSSQPVLIREADLFDYAGPPIFSERIQNVALRFLDAVEDTSGEVTLIFDGFDVTARVSLSPADRQRVMVMRATGNTSIEAAAALLQRDPQRYSAAVYGVLPPHEISAMLQSFTFKGERLIEHVDPRPLTIYGNYLVLRWSPSEYDPDLYVDPSTADLPIPKPRSNSEIQMSDDRWPAVLASLSWKRWKAKHVDGFQGESFHVPLPTGGVFAEAVLGRSNASEKLDITRFWNWQDSPIPHQAPDIAPVVLGQADREPSAAGLAPVGFQPSLAQLPTIQAAPDPGAANALLQTLANAAIFRDASGVESTSAALSGALNSSTSAAGTSASLSANAFSEALRASVDLQKHSGQAGVNRSKLSTIGATFNALKNDEGQGGQTPSGGGTSPSTNEGQGTAGNNALPTGQPSSGGQNPSSSLALRDMMGVQRPPIEKVRFGPGPSKSKWDLSPDLLSPMPGDVQSEELAQSGFSVRQLSENETSITNEVKVLLGGFETGKSNLNIVQRLFLDFIGNEGADNGFFKITEITGHASETGPEKSSDPNKVTNVTLARERAAAVASYLIFETKLDASKLPDPTSDGSQNPIQGDPGVDNPLNRSVVLTYQVVIPKPQPIKVKPPAEPEPTPSPCPDGSSKHWGIRILTNLGAYPIGPGVAGVGGGIWLGEIVQLKPDGDKFSEVRKHSVVFVGVGVGLNNPTKYLKVADKTKKIFDALTAGSVSVSVQGGVTPFNVSESCFAYGDFYKDLLGFKYQEVIIGEGGISGLFGGFTGTAVWMPSLGLYNFGTDGKLGMTTVGPDLNANRALMLPLVMFV